jgi:cytochrome c peroxidase
MKITALTTLFVLSLTLTPLSSFSENASPMNQLRSGLAALPDLGAAPSDATQQAKITLGKKLYVDPRLSRDKDISCNSCHSLANFGVDNQKTSPGHKKQRGGRNSPSSFNAALHMAQFWDGRAKDVEEQALGPIQNPIEMAMAVGGKEVVARLSADAEYHELFKRAFPTEKDPLTFANVGKAIGAFERTLVTPSRFDAFVKGDDKALSDAGLAGLKTFKEVGCMACHNGATLGGQMYQKLGLVKPYATKDLGRFEVTKNEFDKNVFKVPSLRNVEKTAPYLHDGSIATLEEAVRIMGEYQLGRKLDDKQVAEIVTFLKSLTGKLP